MEFLKKSRREREIIKEKATTDIEDINVSEIM